VTSVKLKGIRLVPTLAALALIVLTVSLGNWQTRRAEEKRLLQLERDRAAAQPPVRLSRETLANPEALIGRRVVAKGSYIERHSVFVDNRSYRGQAGFHLITPFAVEGADQPILVLRGWLPQDPAHRSRLPQVPLAPMAVEIEALAQRDFDQVLELSKAPPPGPDDRLWQNASVEAIARWSGLTLAPVVLRQLAEVPQMPHATSAADLVRDWPSPGAGVDKHRAYAFQWYSMATLVAALWLLLVWRARRTQSTT